MGRAEAGEPASSDTAAAEVIDEQARAYFKVGAFEDAAREFARAYELDHLASRLFNAGLAYEKAGKLQKAAETYEKFLSLESEGAKAVEARARKLALDKQISSDQEAQRQADAKRAMDSAVQEHTRRANEHLGSGDYQAAAAEFEKAYQTGKDPELLFDKAEALRLGAHRTEAAAAYRQYRRMAPDGINAVEARQRQTELEAVSLGSIDSSAGAPRGKESSGPSWAWLGLSAGAIAAGLAMDLVPDSASNGRFDAMDLGPVALYGLGAGFLYKGVF